MKGDGRDNAQTLVQEKRSSVLEVNGKVADGQGRIRMTTSDIPEEGYHYFTDDRARAAVAVEKGQAGGLASLNEDGVIPAVQLPFDMMSYQGTWDADSNQPTLSSGAGTKGHWFLVKKAGNTDLGGITTWSVGDQAVYNGATWEQIPAMQAPSVTLSTVGMSEPYRPMNKEFATVEISAARGVVAHRGRLYYTPTGADGYGKVIMTELGLDMKVEDTVVISDMTSDLVRIGRILSDGQFIYLVAAPDNARPLVMRYDPDTGAHTTLDLTATDTDLQNIADAVILGETLVLAPAAGSKLASIHLDFFFDVIVVDLAAHSDLSGVDVAELTDFGAVTTDGRFVYLAPGSGGTLVRLSRNFAEAASIKLTDIDTDLTGFKSAVCTAHHLFCVPHDHTKVVSVDMSDFTTVTSFDLATVNTDLKGFTRGLLLGNWLYLTGKGRMARLNVIDFSTVETLRLNWLNSYMTATTDCIEHDGWLYFSNPANWLQLKLKL